jgi:hypothetical protein
MGMHEGIERAALLQMSKEKLVDIIMVSRYGESYAHDYVQPPLQRCTKCGALRHGKSIVALAHRAGWDDTQRDKDGHHIAINVDKPICLGPWEFVEEV